MSMSSHAVMILLLACFSTSHAFAQPSPRDKTVSLRLRREWNSGVSLSSAQGRRRIIGGRDVAWDQWKFTVAFVSFRNSRDAFCAGSLLSRTKVLTAAHCFLDIDGSYERQLDRNAWAVIGSPDLRVGGERIQIKHVTTHPDFRFGIASNREIDVAVVELSTSVSADTSFVTMNRDPNNINKNVQSTAYVAGWGLTNEMLGTYASRLLSVDVPIRDDSACHAVAGYPVSPHYMCAGAEGRDSCSADSGGPLIVGIGTAPVQIGIVASGVGAAGCGGYNSYGMYTKVHLVADWVLSAMGATSPPGATLPPSTQVQCTTDPLLCTSDPSCICNRGYVKNLFSLEGGNGDCWGCTEEGMCKWANDGVCDEPRECEPGTDGTDCVTLAPTRLPSGYPTVMPISALPSSAPTRFFATAAPTTLPILPLTPPLPNIPLTPPSPSFSTSCTGDVSIQLRSESIPISDGPGDYAPSMFCTWTIQSDRMLLLSFNEFATETSYDFVKVYDGLNRNILLASLSGQSNLPSVLRSSAGSGGMLIEFSTDFSVQAAGFSAVISAGNSATAPVAPVIPYIPPTIPSLPSAPSIPSIPSAPSSNGLCTGQMMINLASGSALITTGNTNYLPAMTCSWSVPYNGAVTITFTRFETETSYDFVKVYDGLSTSSLLASLHGPNLPGEIRSSVGSGGMLVQFSSDQSVQAIGFEAFVSASTTPSSPAIAAPTTPVPPPFSAPSIPIYSPPSLSQELTSCNGEQLLTITREGTTLSDGPLDYSPSMSCVWRVLHSGSVVLTFTQFATESSYDFVKVYDGQSRNFLLGSFSGQNIPRQIQSSGASGGMLIEFVSDYSVQAAGFTAFVQPQDNFTPSIPSPTIGIPAAVPSWPVSIPSSVDLLAPCSGEVTVSMMTGSAALSDGPSDYSPSMTCMWRIPHSGSLRLSFSQFATENSYDFVKVYDGTSQTGSILGSFTGQNLPIPVVTSPSSGGMLLVFTTDESVQTTGFVASVTANRR